MSPSTGIKRTTYIMTAIKRQQLLPGRLTPAKPTEGALCFKLGLMVSLLTLANANYLALARPVSHCMFGHVFFMHRSRRHLSVKSKYKCP